MKKPLNRNGGDAEIDRAALLLAASGLSERAIRRFIEFLIELGPSQSVQHIYSLRNRVFDRLQRSEVVDYESEIRRPMRRVASQVLQLLQTDSGIAPQVAVKLLESSIKSGRPPSFKLPPFRAKQGFAYWLDQVSDVISSSELLHHAALVRNMYAHSDESNWPLKSRTK